MALQAGNPQLMKIGGPAFKRHTIPGYVLLSKYMENVIQVVVVNVFASVAKQS